jgi:hypothetical protein
MRPVTFTLEQVQVLDSFLKAHPEVDNIELLDFFLNQIGA